VTWNGAREESHLVGREVRAADAASIDSDDHLAGSNLGLGKIDEL
jgi:hypothetical protein